MADEKIVGCLDGVAGNVVRGWVWNESVPASSVRYEIWINGQAAVGWLANQYRADLESNNIGNGEHGFTIEVPSWALQFESGVGSIELMAHGSQDVSVKPTKIAKLSILSPCVTVDDSTPFALQGTDMRGAIESVQHGSVHGWLLVDNKEAVTLSIELDGASVGQARTKPTELETRHQAPAKSQVFHFDLPAEQFDGATHQLQLSTDAGDRLLRTPVLLRLLKPEAPNIEAQVLSTRYGYIRGWTRNRSLLSERVSITVKVDNREIDTSTADKFVPEFGIGGHGFLSRIPSWAKDGEVHDIEVWHAGKKVFSGQHKLAHCAYFDIEYYLRTNPDIKKAGIDPISHYLQFGFVEAQQGCSSFPRSPHPLFDARWYREQVGLEGTEDAFAHYLEEGWQRGIGPCPLFDPHFYRMRYSVDEKLEPIADFVQRASDFGTLTHPLFDPGTYQRTVGTPLTRHPLFHYQEKGNKETSGELNYMFSWAYIRKHHSDLIRSAMDPIRHYVQFGASEGRVLGPKHEEINSKTRFLRGQGLRRGIRRTTAIIVSHDANRTGAPMIILEITRRLVEQWGINCCVMLLKGGPLEADFAKLAPTFNVASLRDEGVLNPAFVPWVANEPGRTFAICNSAESIDTMRLLDGLRVPVISLVHEFAVSYKPERYAKAFRHSQHVVFPAELVKTSALKHLGDELTDEEVANCHVIPQGLLDKRFLSGNRAAYRQSIREELNLHDDTFIVLGCGYLDLRKGCDLFISTALRVRQRAPEMNFAFVWLGGAVSLSGTSSEFWIGEDIRRAGLEGTVFFPGEKKDVKPWFYASDVFLMVSRLDPFPCVVHEAMATELPVIAFKGATGSVDAIADTGVVVDYLNIEQAAEAIQSMAESPENARALGQRARNRVINEYDFDHYVVRLLELISTTGLPHIGRFHAESDSPTDTSDIEVLFISSDWSLSGVNSGNEAIAAGLSAHGWDVKFLFTQEEKSVRSSANLPDSVDLPQRAAHEFLDRGKSVQSMWESLQDRLETATPKIIITTYDHLSAAAIPALTDRVGTVLVHHSDDNEYYEQTYRLGRFCDRIVCVSQYMRSKIEDLNPSFAEKIQVTPNSMVTADDITAPREPHLNGSPIRLIYTGRLVQTQKQARHFVDVVAALDEAGVDYVLELVGSDLGEGSVAYITEALSSHIERNQVLLPGRVATEQVKEKLLSSDVFLLISTFEGFPQSVLEAMALGCVPIVMKIPSGIPELIEDGKDGFIVEQMDYEAVAARVKTLANNPERLEAYSRAARQKIVDSRFLTSDVVEQYHELLSELATKLIGGMERRPASLNWKSDVGDIALPAHIHRHPDH